MADRRDRRDFTREEVLALLDYDPGSGIFRWKIESNSRGGKIYPGDEAGSIKDGYVHIALFGRKYRAQHLAWLVMTGEWPPRNRDVDHENRKRADNAWLNLRLATRAQNNMNSRVHSHNKSGVKGVSWRQDIGKWHARIVVGGKALLLGNFADKKAAIVVRQRAERELFGEFACSERPAT